jgi:very-short-patch-repair endonuclease
VTALAQNPPRHGEGDRAKRCGGGHEQLQRPIVYTARRLRREMTPPEARLWQILRTRPSGYKFRRQHPIDHYVVDFFCREARLIVEVDGSAHEGERVGRDERRDAFLKKLGFSILRVPAPEIIRDPAAVTEGVLARAGSPLHQAPPGPPPRTGEE